QSTRDLIRVNLKRENQAQPIYPYGVAVLPAGGGVAKIYVSCWNDSTIAVIDPSNPEKPVNRIAVDRHPTAMLFNAARTRLYITNSNADSISVLDTVADKEIERISVRLAEKAQLGSSPESLSLSEDGATLYVANAHSNALAVVELSPQAQGKGSSANSKLRGF